MLADSKPLDVVVRQRQRPDKHNRQHAHGALNSQITAKGHGCNHDRTSNTKERQCDGNVPVDPVQENDLVPDVGDKLEHR